MNGNLIAIGVVAVSAVAVMALGLKYGDRIATVYRSRQWLKLREELKNEIYGRGNVTRIGAITRRMSELERKGIRW